MKQLNWGDELCGKVITPEGNWIVVNTKTGEWIQCPPTSEGFYQGFNVYQDVKWGTFGLQTYGGDRLRPIYPPRNWAGKTEAELWEAMRDGHDVMDVYPGTAVYVKRDGYGCMEPDIPYTMIGNGGECTYETLILALQNALVLSKRLKGVPVGG